MRQQVNLFRSEFSLSQPFPNFWHGLQVLAVFAGVMLLVFVWQLWQFAQVTGDLDDIKDESNQVGASLQVLQAQLPADRLQPIERQITALNNELQQLQKIRALMSEQHMDSRTSTNQLGFSNQLEGLARQYRAGISLAEIKLFEGGNRIDLGGFASPPALAPRYLSGLQGDPAFNGVRFGQLSLLRDKNTGHTAFQIKHEDAVQ